VDEENDGINCIYFWIRSSTYLSGWR